MRLKNNIRQQSELKKSQLLWRSRRVVQSIDGVNVVCDDQSLITFSSNNYLGLSGDLRVLQAFKSGVDRYGASMCSSSAVMGYTNAHQQLEDAFAAWLGFEKALLFSCGYGANVGVLTALLDKHSVAYHDKLNHASLVDGVRFSDAQSIRYAHGDIEHLQQRINDQNNDAGALVISDSVFSMDGDVANVPALSDVARTHLAMLMIDDAHGIGILGKTGRGVMEHYGLSSRDIDILICPLGKALGSFGAVVLGETSVIDVIKQSARSGIYSTALPSAQACASLMSLQILQEESWRREALNALIAFFESTAREFELPFISHATPIQVLMIGDNARVMMMAEKCWNAGFWVAAIRSPTVPKDKARLRVTLTVEHSKQHIHALLTTLSDIYHDTQ